MMVMIIKMIMLMIILIMMMTIMIIITIMHYRLIIITIIIDNAKLIKISHNGMLFICKGTTCW